MFSFVYFGFCIPCHHSVLFCVFVFFFFFFVFFLNHNRFNKQMKLNKDRVLGLNVLYNEMEKKNREIKRMRIQLSDYRYLQNQYAKYSANKKKPINNLSSNVNNYSNVHVNFSSNNNNNTQSRNNANAVGNNNSGSINNNNNNSSNNNNNSNNNPNDSASLSPTIYFDSELEQAKSHAKSTVRTRRKSQKQKPISKLQSKKEIDDSTDSNAREGEATPPPQSIGSPPQIQSAVSLSPNMHSNNDEGIVQPQSQVGASMTLATMSHVAPADVTSTQSHVVGPINNAIENNLSQPIASQESQGPLLGGATQSSTRSFINCQLNSDCAVHNSEPIDELNLIQRSISALQEGELSKDGDTGTIDAILKYQDKLKNLLREWLRVDGNKQSLKDQLFQQLQDKFHHTTTILNYNLHKALKKQNTVFSAQTDSRIDELSQLIEKIESANNQVAKEDLEKQLSFFFLPGK